MNTENKDEQSNPVNLPEQFLKLESLLHRHFEKMRHGNEPLVIHIKGKGESYLYSNFSPLLLKKNFLFY